MTPTSGTRANRCLERERAVQVTNRGGDPVMSTTPESSRKPWNRQEMLTKIKGLDGNRRKLQRLTVPVARSGSGGRRIRHDIN